MLTRTRSLTAVLLASVAGAATAVPAAQAATAKPASAAAIIKDCKSDSVVSKRYRLADLKKAKTALKKNKSAAKKCDVGVTAAIAGLSGKAGKNSTSAIYKNCNSRGTLTSKYKKATLKKAVKNVPDDVAEYTNCKAAIQSQYNTVTS